MGTGRSTAEFLPSQAIVPLKSYEYRYWVDGSSTGAQSSPRRSCVKNRETGDKRFESPIRTVDGVRRLPSWH
eukprot:1727999-Amphidinium_carterae.1